MQQALSFDERPSIILTLLDNINFLPPSLTDIRADQLPRKRIKTEPPRIPQSNRIKLRSDNCRIDRFAVEVSCSNERIINRHAIVGRRRRM